ncbi:MAG TPA: hypothetical protein VMU94_26280 [Streptosporangiaceae bacterium]|nr:hypothetical protein [Streptosporangiaceae bacterium]
MMTALNADDIDRTALLALHDGTQPTLEAALSAHAATGIAICADSATCRDTQGQAALLTAAATAARAFGNVVVFAAAADAVLAAGPSAGRTLASALLQEGTPPADPPGAGDIAAAWPVLLIGSSTPVPPQPAGPGQGTRPVLRAAWTGWLATVQADASPATRTTGPPCILAAIAAAAIGVSEAFGSIRAVPGNDAGYRDVQLNLWHPGADAAGSGPALAHAPASWWLVGLGHLGQAYAWVISWLTYLTPPAIELVLQDTDRTSPANHSTGVLTPARSDGVRKTRLIAGALDHAGIDTQIIERRLGSDLRMLDGECHVALIGVDNIPARLLISDVGWRLAIDVGLGTGPRDFASMLLRRFPGAQPSNQVTAWIEIPAEPVTIPSTPAFSDLKERHDHCGVVQLAGKAVGASFVGITAACLAVAEATRELHGGSGLDITTLNLLTMDSDSAPAAEPADVISTRLRTA